MRRAPATLARKFAGAGAQRREDRRSSRARQSRLRLGGSRGPHPGDAAVFAASPGLLPRSRAGPGREDCRRWPRSRRSRGARAGRSGARGHDPLPAASFDCYNSTASASLGAATVSCPSLRRGRPPTPRESSPMPAAILLTLLAAAAVPVAQEARPADPGPAPADRPAGPQADDGGARRSIASAPGAERHEPRGAERRQLRRGEGQPLHRLPDPLVCKDGTKVTTPEQWWTSGGRRSSRTSTARSTAASRRTCRR